MTKDYNKKIWKMQHCAFKISMSMAILGFIYICILNAFQIPITNTWLTGYGLVTGIPAAFNTARYLIKKRNGNNK